MSSVPANAAGDLAPDGYWYLCNASQFQIANLVPLLELGLERCGGVAILIGRSEDPPSENDRTQSIEPASRFMTLIKSLAHARDRADLKVREIPGHPHDESSWSGPFREFLEKEQPGYIVYNYSHGTRATMLGALFALMAWGQASGSAGIVALTPPRSGRPAHLRQSLPHEARIDVSPRSRVTLEQWVGLLGYRVSETRDEVARTRQQHQRWLADRLMRNEKTLHANARMAILNAAIAPLRKENEHVSVYVSIDSLLGRLPAGNRNFVESARRWLQAIVQELAHQAPNLLTHDGARLALAPGAAEFLAGGWFEELVHAHASLRFRALQSSVHVGVKLQAIRSDAADREIDVAILHDNQLHLIECKTGAWEGGVRNDSERVRPTTLRHLNEGRQILCGPYGNAALVGTHDPSGADNKDAMARIDAEARRLRLWPPIHGPHWAQALDVYFDSIIGRGQHIEG